ncbi:MAG TPA: PH domain-containing protein [Steroidobacteraceae bacterium]|nr:PH domain-containing protein [Steroidobacteraceae bacterium]
MSAMFRSKVDGKFKWLALLLPGAALAALFTTPRGSPMLWLPVGLVFLAALLVCWILFATYYELQADELVAHCGPFTWRIPLREITQVRESSSVRSGPALSMDRLEVVHLGGRVLIVSPADKAQFIAAIQRRAPQLRA